MAWKKVWLCLMLSAACAVADGAGMFVEREAIVPAGRIVLFNGKDLRGWDKVITAEPYSAPGKTWSVSQEGTIRCTGEPMGYLATQQVYANYRLHVEYRWTAKTKNQNSGVFVHKVGPDDFFLPKAVECQLKEGRAGDFVLLSGATVNGIKNKGTMSVARSNDVPCEKPFGEWNSVDLRIDGNTEEIAVNGIKVNRGEKMHASSGQICLQSEGGAIEFRNVWIEPLGGEK